MNTKEFNLEAFEHIQGSGMDPEDLAKLYGITKRLVDRIQMGKVDFPAALQQATNPEKSQK